VIVGSTPGVELSHQFAIGRSCCSEFVFAFLEFAALAAESGPVA
jgi:hypothetical protein